MPTGWQTFPVEFKGGLITNVSPLQQGINNIGSARELRNFEPSIEGGYRRVQGFIKYNDNAVPSYGSPRVQASGQTGTTLNLANVFYSPVVGDKFTIAGNATVYTISNTSPGYDDTNKTFTGTITPSLAASPADKALVTFVNNTNLVQGVGYFDSEAFAYRDGTIWRNNTAGGWTQVNVPSYGTVLVDAGSQTGNSLSIDGLTSAPSIGDTFSVAGIEKVYTVVNKPTVVGSDATLVITPALASSPANNALVTFISSDRGSFRKLRYSRYNISGTPTIMFLDGANYPAKYDGTTFTTLDGISSDLLGAEFVVSFKNQLFFSKGSLLGFTAPYSDDNFSPADGAGDVSVGEDITGLIVFREQLIIFTRRKILRLTGNTIADFNLQPITLDIGCVSEDTIQEIGGDIMFMAPDGLRLLSATDRIGDFGLSTASKPIQDVMVSFKAKHTSFSSCVIRGKSQYRLFGYAPGISSSSSQGILGTQFADQSSQGMAWAKLRGINAYVADSYYDDSEEEVVLFAEANGYVYKMEEGFSFDGSNIRATFSTPHFTINDPRMRKTVYKLTTYVDPRGSVSGSASIKLDFDQPNTPEPRPVSFTNGATSTAAFYGDSEYGTATFGGKLVNVFTNQVVGAGKSISIQFVFDGTDPEFSLDAMALEFASNDRQ
tara:strand:- start:486 stop:2468 length:1983 start_codon:yes stop_codon:yes gene_type:complete